MYEFLTYAIYITISIVICVYVGKQCHNYGRRYICHVVHNDEHLADAINNLLLVGYYLINIGYIIYALQSWETTAARHHLTAQCVLHISRILIILSVLHYLNLLGILLYGRYIKSHNHQ